MIIIEDWSKDEKGEWYCFHSSVHEDGTYDFNHVLTECCKRNKRISKDNEIVDTVPTYIGKGVYVWQKFIFNVEKEI